MISLPVILFSHALLIDRPRDLALIGEDQLLQDNNAFHKVVDLRLQHNSGVQLEFEALILHFEQHCSLLNQLQTFHIHLMPNC